MRYNMYSENTKKESISMRKIIVTEENFERILKRLQKICNKYKMFEFYRVFSEDMTEKKEYRRNSIGFRYSRYRKQIEFFSHNRYVRVTKHRFREDYEMDKDSFNAKHFYSKMSSLIHLDLSGCSALVIGEGDKVQFLPFGGFIVWTDDNYTRFENPITIFKHIYFPDFFKGKISNLEQENAIRDKEWEEESKEWEDFDWEDFDTEEDIWYDDEI